MDGKITSTTTKTQRHQQKKMKYKPLSKKEEEIAKIVVESAYKVHSTLGLGLLENIYEICFCYELKKRGLKYKRQVFSPILYEEMKIEDALFIKMKKNHDR